MRVRPSSELAETEAKLDALLPLLRRTCGFAPRFPTAGCMINRGLGKSGSREPYDADRDQSAQPSRARSAASNAVTGQHPLWLLRNGGVENILALRGDPPHGQERWTKTDGGLEYSNELIALLRDEYDFSVGGAAFPETHIHAPSPDDDLRFLKQKVDAGATFLITQVFFDNRFYFDFVARAREIGIDVPIVPGVMPILNTRGVKRMTELSAAHLPSALVAELEAREDDEEAVHELGVAYATLQCAELLAGGAPGIHFITLNRSPATRAILSALRLMRPWEGTRR